jgi:hypothetical protein
MIGQLKNQTRRSLPEASLPPGNLCELAWDILLALRTEATDVTDLSRLASRASVSISTLVLRLSWLEERRLVAARKHRVTGEFGAILTTAGRESLDMYLSAIDDLQFGWPDDTA